jgi:hypothetical protein
MINWTSVLPFNGSASRDALLDHPGSSCLINRQSSIYYLLETNASALLPQPQMYNQAWKVMTLDIIEVRGPGYIYLT